MVDLKMERPQVSAAQLKPVLLGVTVVGLLLAAWLGGTAFRLHRDDARNAAVQSTRDDVALAVQAAINSEKKNFAAHLAGAPVQQALAEGNLDLAAAKLTDGWSGASAAQLLAPDLAAGYAALGAKKGGFGRLAALESAVAANAAAAWVVQDEGKPQLALAAPAAIGDQTPAIAIVLLPMQRIGASLASASLPDGSYLALRQGGVSVMELGEVALADSAESLAKKIPGTELRVAAAVPGMIAGPMGLGWIASAIAATVCLLLALLAWRLSWGARRGKHSAAAVDSVEPTLTQTMDSPVAEAAAPVAAPAAPKPVSSVAIDRSIFRAYDIRGIVGQSLDAGVAELIGHAIGTVMHDQGHSDIVVGRDGRLSGPSLSDGLIVGLRKAGRNVIDIGLAPTPLVYYAGHILTGKSAVMLTGSHNPPDYNGFKVVIGGETLSGDAITNLYSRIAEDELYTAPTPGRIESRDINEDYVQRVASDVQLDRPLKVVVDAGNGVAGELGPRVLAAIGADVVPLYCDIDGTFPNHHPDPSELHNLADLIQTVDRLGADLGLAFDGDGDRLGVVTRDGQNIFPDRLLMLFAADVLERNPGALIIFDVKCTGRLPGHILRHGGSPLMWKTGHSLIKAKMRETDAELAGEMSGHFFFKERWYGFDDGIYSAARLLEILAAQPRSPSETLNALPDGVSTPEIKVDAPNGDPHSFVDKFRDAARFEGARLSTIDGLRVDFSDGWGLVRASNTTPILVMRFDADSREALARIQGEFRSQLLALDPGLKLPF